ncbi:MAG: pyridoxal phosphate-dependent aminotransferase [Planctomycetota bacterium]
MPRIADRIQSVQDPVIPIVGKLISQSPGTISLGQGIVHYDPPSAAIEAVQSQSQHFAAVHRYGDVCGTEELLAAIREKVKRENGFDLTERDVIYTAGSNMAFLNAVLAIADVGDEVILLSPYYFNHDMAIEIAGCKTVAVSTMDDYQINLDGVRAAITPRTRAIVTVSPNNPTGVIYPRESLAAVNALCREHDIYHISDEAYEYFVYAGDEHFSPASLPGASEHTISLYTLSKAYGMAGWRAGYMVVPSSLTMPIKKVQDTNLVCPPMLNQLVAKTAIECGVDWVRPKVKALAKVRSAVLDVLADIPGCQIPTPSGAFYMVLKLDTHWDDMDLVKYLIHEHQVAALPGGTFGLGEQCGIRISYGALQSDTVVAGAQRLRTGLLQALAR